MPETEEYRYDSNNKFCQRIRTPYTCHFPERGEQKCHWNQHKKASQKGYNLRGNRFVYGDKISRKYNINSDKRAGCKIQAQTFDSISLKNHVSFTVKYRDKKLCIPEYHTINDSRHKKRYDQSIL